MCYVYIVACATKIFWLYLLKGSEQKYMSYSELLLNQFTELFEEIDDNDSQIVSKFLSEYNKYLEIQIEKLK